MALSAPYTHIQQKLEREECVVLDGAIVTTNTYGILDAPAGGAS